jgi:hypothetical protein
MKLVIIIISLLLCGCNVIDVHPYDCNIKGERDINRRNIIRIEQALVGKKEFTFAFISDAAPFASPPGIASYPARLTAFTISSVGAVPSTVIVPSSRLTATDSTPGTFLTARSTAATHAAHDIPLTL